MIDFNLLRKMSLRPLLPTPFPPPPLPPRALSMNDFNLLRKMSRTPEVAGAKERQASGRSTVACHIYFYTVLPDSGPFVMQHDPVDLLLPFNGDNGFCGLPLTSYSPGHAIPSRSPPLPHSTHTSPPLRMTNGAASTPPASTVWAVCCLTSGACCAGRSSWVATLSRAAPPRC